MTRVRAALAGLWRDEPVRTALAPLILVLVAAGLAKAGVDASLAGILATVVLGVLGFTAQEIARAKVVPVPKRDAAVTGAVQATVAAARDVLVQQAVAQGPEIVREIGEQARQHVDEYIGQHRAGR